MTIVDGAVEPPDGTVVVHLDIVKTIHMIEFWRIEFLIRDPYTGPTKISLYWEARRIPYHTY